MSKKAHQSNIKLPGKDSTLAMDYERYLPDMRGLIHFEHLHRYLHAASYVGGKVVLDVSCGEGYGTYILSQQAKSAIGVDISSQTIKAAKKKYPFENIDFLVSDAASTSIENDSMDMVVSFETIEHLQKHDTFLAEIKRVLKKEGVAFISSPNKYIFSAINGMSNEFHISEITHDEFGMLMKRWFTNVLILNQQVFGASHLWGGSQHDSPIYFEKNEYSEILQYNEIENPLYSYAVVSDSDLPAIPNSFYLDTLNKHNGIHYYNMDGSIYANVILELYQQQSKRDEEHKIALKNVEEKLAQSQQANTELTRDYRRLESEKNMALAEIETKLSKSRHDYKILIENRDRMIAQKDAELSDLSRQHQTVVYKIESKLNDSHSKLQALISNHQNIISEKDDELIRLRQKHERAQTNLEKELEKSRNKYEGFLKTHDSMILAQKDALNRLEQMHIRELNKKEAQLRKLINDYKTQLVDQENLVAQKDKEIAKLNQSYTATLNHSCLQLERSRQKHKLLLQNALSDRTMSSTTRIIGRLNPRHWLSIIRGRALLAASDLFDSDYYLIENSDVKQAGVDPIKHYLTFGWRELRDPSLDFSTFQYLLDHADVLAARINPLVHYLRFGHKERRTISDVKSAATRNMPHRKPNQVLDANKTSTAADQLPNTNVITANPIEEELNVVRNSIFFNEQYYRKTHEDLANVDIDMVKHYCEHGWREARNPSVLFNTAYYLEMNPDIRTAGINPLFHYIKSGKSEGRSPSPINDYDYEENCRFGEIKTDIKPIAFYLPQFHAIPENNAWWGDGFTEWTNTRKAKPLIAGQNQPREPHEDIGYYDLTDWRVLKKQTEIAGAHGIYGFCFYHYWFAGKRLLEKPVDLFLEHQEIDFPFCLCWANENWTRRWDGFDQEILIAQHHSERDDIAFIDDLKRYLADDRYIKIDGKPIIMVYRPAILPNAKKTTDRWRERLRQKGIGEVYLICTYGAFADTTKPNYYGFDAGYEFAPNIHMPHQTYLQSVSGEEFSGNLCSYRQFVNDILYNREIESNNGFDLYYSVMLEWDNTPRRGKESTIFTYYNPLIYREWLDKTIEITRQKHTTDKRFIFINAWNEWAEGAHLEPDKRFGYRSLNETSRALCDIQPGRKLPKISVIVPNYNHAKYLRKRLDSIYNQTYKNIEVILLDDCSSDNSREILDEYAALYPQISRRIYNSKNSGGVFRQWANGIKHAEGDLVWIAESDDYCDEDFLDTLVQNFEDEAVLLAYSHCVFVDENEIPLPEGGFEHYVSGIDSEKWQTSYIETAHNEVKSALGIINTIPNSSGVVIRRPQNMKLLEDETWHSMSVAGDWIFYLHIIHGGKLAYDMRTKNYFRRYEGSAAESTYKHEVFYREVGSAAGTIASLYNVPIETLERNRDCYLDFYKSMIGDDNEQFLEWYGYEKILEAKKHRLPTVMVSLFAFYPGGAELVPIRLANEFKRLGVPVILHSGKGMPRDHRIRSLVRNDIPVLETDQMKEIKKAIHDFGIDVLNSHHWHIQRYPTIDPTIFLDLPKHIATLHGMIEDESTYNVNSKQINVADQFVDTWVYTADKNIEPFFSMGLHSENQSRFVKIPNGMAAPKSDPIPRKEMNIPDDAFVLCNVSRAIPEKGWNETIAAIEMAIKISEKDIRLILVGSGPVYTQLSKESVPDFVFMPGFDDRSFQYYSASDMGIMLSRFRSESFPLTITDCLFAGKPYIASDIGEIRNILTTKEGVAGAIFELDNWTIPVEAVAEIIAEFATDKEKYEKAKSLVSGAASRYTIEQVAKQYLNLFQNKADTSSPFEKCLLYNDDQWFEIMQRSVDEPVIDGIPMPGFPNEKLQIAIVGSSFKDSLKEADAFTKQVKHFMREYGAGLTPSSKILDFGTGWGRMYRFFLNTVRPENIFGIDVDESFIDICKKTIPCGKFATNNPYPPLGFENDYFDAVVGYSVFSHLNKDVGLKWIEEFERILKPGGILVMTTHSQDFIEYCNQLRTPGQNPTSEWQSRLAQKAFLDKQQAYRDYNAGRFLYVTGATDATVRKADIYGDAVLSPKFVKREWTKYIDFVDFIDDKAVLPQALIVMRKPQESKLKIKRSSHIKKLSFYDTKIFQKYKKSEKSYRKESLGFCPICEKKSKFVANHEWLRDNYRCELCNSIPRQRHVQHILNTVIPGWKEMRIHESSPCADYLKKVAPGYTASQYFPEKDPGESVGEFTNQNLESLSFSDNTFDIFLSQDVLEHVFNPKMAIQEMLRVVKPGGYVIFTIPIFHGKSTLQRAKLNNTDEIEYLADAVYHGNPIDKDGSLAVWDYGDDIVDQFKFWSRKNELQVFNRPIPEMGIEGEFLDVFCIQKYPKQTPHFESEEFVKQHARASLAGRQPLHTGQLAKILYLHIGLHKTGTSTIQKFLGNNRSRLGELGLIVPGPGDRENLHHEIALQAGIKTDLTTARKKFKNAIRKLAQSGDKYVISSEVFSKRDRIHIEVLDELKNFFSTIKVIAYLRRGDAMLESAYNQIVKTTPLSRLFSEGKWYNLNYTEILAPLVQIFGKDNMVVRPFEQSQLKNNSIISDFLACIGVDPLESFLIPDNRINKSLTLDALEYKRLINTVLTPKEARLDFAEPIIEFSKNERQEKTGNQKSIYLMSPSERLSLLNMLKVEYKTIANLYLGRKDGKLFFDPLPDPKETWQPYPGLPNDKIESITQYLFNYNPGLVKLLNKKYLSTEYQNNQYFTESFEKLMPAIQKVLQKNEFSAKI